MNEPLSTTSALNPRKEEAQTLFTQLEDCFEASPNGGENSEALRQMKTTGERLKRISSSFNEKVDSLLGQAAILYSPRKHRLQDTPHQSGAQTVAHFMRCDLVSIKTILGRMEDCP